MTMSFVTCDEAMTPQAYNQRYLNLVTDLDKIEVAIDCWAPELQKDLEKLRGAHSCFWGEQQHLLYLRGSSSEAMPSGIPRSRAVQEARVCARRRLDELQFDLPNGSNWSQSCPPMSRLKMASAAILLFHVPRMCPDDAASGSGDGLRPSARHADLPIALMHRGIEWVVPPANGTPGAGPSVDQLLDGGAHAQRPPDLAEALKLTSSSDAKAA
jgi:hypothetical protein